MWDEITFPFPNFHGATANVANTIAKTLASLFILICQRPTKTQCTPPPHTHTHTHTTHPGIVFTELCAAFLIKYICIYICLFKSKQHFIMKMHLKNVVCQTAIFSFRPSLLTDEKVSIHRYILRFTIKLYTCWCARVHHMVFVSVVTGATMMSSLTKQVLLRSS